ncbi:Endoglucanase [Minicystis rosea]|nr:Endoglucanase [Minicystis rosea]
MMPLRSVLKPLLGLAGLVSLTGLFGCIPDVPTAAPTGGGGAGQSPLTGCPPGGPRPTGVLRRGMNVGNALDAPTEGAWGVTLTPELFEAIAAAGFDHVRIPVRFSAHAQATAPFTIDEAFFQRVDWAIDQAQSRGLAAIVDLHHYEELMKEPDAHAARFLGLWRQIAARYRGRPATVFLELLNEPTDKLTADRWNTLLAEGIRVVRGIDPAREIIVDSTFWAAAKELQNLTIPTGDPHLVASFHTYQPILFTHQGMSWMPPEYATTGVVFPGPPSAPIQPAPAAQQIDWVAAWFRGYNTVAASDNPGGMATVNQEFQMARAYMDRTKLRLYMGEFGAGDKADMASRVTWTCAVRRSAERLGIGWAYWDDGGTFKIYDRQTRSWNAALKSALLD